MWERSPGAALAKGFRRVNAGQGRPEILTHSGRAATTGPRTSLVRGSGLRDVGDFL